MTVPEIKFNYPSYIVGGWTRDHFLGIPSKDIDVCMVAPTFEDMEQAIRESGGEIFLSTPQYLTIRCKIPSLGAVDVALARKDGEYSDGRRPDSTEIADSVVDDLSRRDFRMNAIAIDLSNGEVIDPFDGQKDIQDRIIRTVGNPEDRFKEDYLRLLRAIRFATTKKFRLNPDIITCLHDCDIMAGLKNVSTERIYEELEKCFRFDTIQTLHYLKVFSLLNKVFNEKLRLKPTMEK